MEIYLIIASSLVFCLYLAAVLHQLQTKHLKLTVIRRENINNELFTFVVARSWWCRWLPLPRYAAGQSVAISIPGDNTSRRYSIAHWHARPFSYEFAVKRESNGRLSPRLQSYAQPGSTLIVGRPEGQFVLSQHPQHRRAVLIAGGVGITPLLAMYQQQQARGKPYQEICVYWQIRHDNEAMYRNQLGYAARILVSRPSFGQPARINAKLLQHELGNLTDCDFYLCASPHLLLDLQTQLQQCGVSANAIFTEHFNLLGGANSNEIIHYAGKQFRCTGYGSLLQAIEAQGLTINSDCRAGYCGCCAVRVERGHAEHFAPHENNVSPGYVLSCCALPKSEVWLSQTQNITHR